VLGHQETLDEPNQIPALLPSNRPNPVRRLLLSDKQGRKASLGRTFIKNFRTLFAKHRCDDSHGYCRAVQIAGGFP